MKKRILAAFVVLLMVSALCVGCKSTEETTANLNVEPELEQIHEICELSVLDCYYHNVAKYKKEDAAGILFWWWDRTFWIEYSGKVRVGIDSSKVKMELDGDTVTISIPQAEILGISVDSDSLTENSFYIAKDSAAVQAEHQHEAIREAEAKMKESAENNQKLLTSATNRAKQLIANYVQNIGNLLGKEYTIRWVEDGEVTGTQKAESSSSESSSSQSSSSESSPSASSSSESSASQSSSSGNSASESTSSKA